MSQLLYQDLLRILPHLKMEMCPAPDPRLPQSLQRLFDTEGGQFTEKKEIVIDDGLLTAGDYCIFRAITVFLGQFQWKELFQSSGTSVL